MKRTVLAASAFSVALLAGPAGCASGDSDAADEPTPKASRAKEPGPARRLATQMITAADLGHGYSVRDFSVAKEKSAFAETPDRITVDRGPCHPLAAAMNQLPLGRPQAFLTRVVSSEKSVGTPAEKSVGTPAEETTAVTYVTLAVYDRGMATAAMDTLLARGVDSCRLGFTARAVNGATRTYPRSPSRKPVRRATKPSPTGRRPRSAVSLARSAPPSCAAVMSSPSTWRWTVRPGSTASPAARGFRRLCSRRRTRSSAEAEG
ncbi:hypothetical protein ACFZDJ_24225 [Streptomyces sp. NPDC007896]|uniref:hypothetical protein n=1 Tax=Streptomyces sp. NPDC007896 TaxID=3364784 RepID=UPI0036E560FA